MITIKTLKYRKKQKQKEGTTENMEENENNLGGKKEMKQVILREKKSRL